MKKLILALMILFSMAACHTKTVEVDNNTIEADTLVLDSLVVDSAQICE